MEIPAKQGQHRISKVYLKQFGFKRDNGYYISVVNKSLKKAEVIPIEKFTKEINIFDLPFKEYELKRHFEYSSSLIENKYSIVISNLKNQKQLTPRNRDILCYFVPNLLCRSIQFCNLITSLLSDSKTRDGFIKEITLLKGDYKEAKQLLDFIKLKFQLNFALGFLMNHMVTILRTFKQVVIKDFDNKGWPTTDNPVFINRNENYKWILPIESEIYFPLSKDFCLYMYHEKSNIINPLRNLHESKINNIDLGLFKSITDKIVFNLDNYLIMPIEIDPDAFLND